MRGKHRGFVTAICVRFLPQGSAETQTVGKRLLGCRWKLNLAVRRGRLRPGQEGL
jgi:hypothetical protein